MSFVPRSLAQSSEDDAIGMERNTMPLSTGSNEHVNDWTVRLSPTDRPLTDLHFVESMINGRYVTRCGRQMYRTTKEGQLVFYQRPDKLTMYILCRQCDR